MSLPSKLVFTFMPFRHPDQANPLKIESDKNRRDHKQSGKLDHSDSLYHMGYIQLANNVQNRGDLSAINYGLCL